MVLEVIIQRGVLIFSRQVRLKGRVGETKAKYNSALDSNNYGRSNDLIECGLCGSKACSGNGQRNHMIQHRTCQT